MSKTRENCSAKKDRLNKTSSVEDRLKILANLIVDRLIEDRRNGINRLQKVSAK